MRNYKSPSWCSTNFLKTLKKVLLIHVSLLQTKANNHIYRSAQVAFQHLPGDMSPLKWTDPHINTLWETTPTFDVSLTFHSPPVLTFPRRLSLSHWTCSLSGRRASQHLFGVQRHSQKIGTHSALTPRHQAFSSHASSRWRKSWQLSYRGFAVS